MSPYGQSIFADAIDAVQAVDLAFDAMINEVDVSKMRVFLSDVLFDKERDGKKRVSIPFGKQDLSEVGVTMSIAEFRAKWYAESPEVSEEKAKALASSAD